jgi:hypothetical protein
LACQDWANTKAAYRFLANPKVDEGDILGGHFAATRQRYDLTANSGASRPVFRNDGAPLFRLIAAQGSDQSSPTIPG